MTKFKAGKASPNPRGRPRGIVDRRSQLRDALRLAVPSLLATLVERAAAGDMQAMKLILDRVSPVLRSQSEPVFLPEFAKANTASEQAQAAIAACADGKLSTDQTADLLAALAAAVKIVESTEVIARIEKLEAAHG